MKFRKQICLIFGMLLIAGPALANNTTSTVNTTNDRITITAHGMSNGTAIKYVSTGGTAIGSARVYSFNLTDDTYKNEATKWDLYPVSYTHLTLPTKRIV